MHVQLFREEVLQARASQFEGHIVLAQPVPMRVAAVVSVILTLLLITYLIVGKYTRTVRVPGRLVPAAGAINVVAPQFGTVTSRRVREGDFVLRGQVLYELSSERTGAFGGIDSRIDASLNRRRDLLQHERALQEEQLQQRGKDLRERHQMTLAEVIRLDQEIELQESRAGMSKRTVERYRTLREQGFVSEFQLTQYENDYLEQMARRHALERAKLDATRGLAQIDAESNQLRGQINLSATQIDRALADLEQQSAEHNARSHVQVLAPVMGKVTSLAAEPGQFTNALAVLATVIPADSPLEAHLFAPSHAVGFVQPEQQVTLRVNAFPYQKFGDIKGVVVSVAQSPISEITGAAFSGPGSTPTGEPVYRISVRLTRQSVMAYGISQKLKTGMTLEADIRQERRRLMSWLIDPVVALAKTAAP